MADKKREEYREKYQIEKIERMSIGSSYKDGYEIYFKGDIPTDRNELENVCAVMTRIFMDCGISIDKEHKRVYYWGYTR